MNRSYVTLFEETSVVFLDYDGIRDKSGEGCLISVSLGAFSYRTETEEEVHWSEFVTDISNTVQFLLKNSKSFRLYYYNIYSNYISNQGYQIQIQT